MINEIEMVQEITNDTQADELVQEILDLRAERERLEIIAKNRIAAINEQLKIKSTALDNKIEFNKSQLAYYAKSLKMKETKTQRSYNLLSGKIVIKKPKTQLVHDNNKILEYFLTAKDETYIKKEPKLEWSKLKEDLEINDNQVINKVTGEIYDIEGLKIEQVGEALDVK